MTTSCRVACRLIMAVVLTILPQVSTEAQTIDAVRDAHADLARVFANEQHGQGWRNFLLFGQLSTQLKNGMAADRAQVARIHERFVKGAKTYRGRELVAARDALQNWLAALNAPTVDKLPAMARAAADDFQKANVREYHRQRAIASQYIANLHRRVHSTANNEEWRAYLGIPNALTQLANGKKVYPPLLDKIAERHAAIAPIWNESTMTGSARALRKIATLARALETTDSQFRKQIKQLADALASFDQQTNAKDAQKIVDTLAWLDERGQVPQLIAAIGTHLNRPNLYLRASRRMVGANIDRTFDEQIDVDNVILGTRQTGIGNARGTVRLELVPDPKRLAMNVTLNSTVNSQTSAYENSVSVDSQSTSHIRALKQMYFDQHGRTLLPAKVNVDSNSDIVNISTDRLIGRRVAERRVYEQQGASSAEARRQTRQSVQGEMDRRIAELIDPAEDYYLREIRLPLLTSGNYPRYLQTRTTRSFVDVAFTQANSRQWSLATPPPPLDKSFDFSLRLHESFGENLIAGIWPGTTVSETKLQKQLKRLFGRSPAGLEVADPERIWTVTFADEKPLTTKFDASTMTVALRIKGFTVGPKAYPGMWITVRYKFAPSDNGVVAQRQGRLEVVPPKFDPESDVKLGARQQVLRSMLRRRFERVFPEEWTVEEFELTGQWKKAGPLSVQRMTAENGWLTIGLNMPSNTTARKQRSHAAR